jgi:hypothetical protein
MSAAEGKRLPSKEYQERRHAEILADPQMISEIDDFCAFVLLQEVVDSWDSAQITDRHRFSEAMTAAQEYCRQQRTTRFMEDQTAAGDVEETPDAR